MVLNKIKSIESKSKVDEKIYAEIANLFEKLNCFVHLGNGGRCCCDVCNFFRNDFNMK